VGFSNMVMNPQIPFIFTVQNFLIVWGTQFSRPDIMELVLSEFSYQTDFYKSVFR
jgi:hypothetical protein